MRDDFVGKSSHWTPGFTSDSPSGSHGIAKGAVSCTIDPPHCRKWPDCMLLFVSIAPNLVMQTMIRFFIALNRNHLHSDSLIASATPKLLDPIGWSPSSRSSRNGNKMVPGGLSSYVPIPSHPVPGYFRASQIPIVLDLLEDDCPIPELVHSDLVSRAEVQAVSDSKRKLNPAVGINICHQTTHQRFLVADL